MLAVDERSATKRSQHPVGPRQLNGEADLSEVMKRLGIEHTYEQELYTFHGVGFRPDFNLVARRRQPRINIELTWADRDFGTRRHAHAVACVRRKSWKIHCTRELYQVRTVLVLYRDWRRIMRHHSCLPAMIRRELAMRY